MVALVRVGPAVESDFFSAASSSLSTKDVSSGISEICWNCPPLDPSLSTMFLLSCVLPLPPFAKATGADRVRWCTFGGVFGEEEDDDEVAAFLKYDSVFSWSMKVGRNSCS